MNSLRFSEIMGIQHKNVAEQVIRYNPDCEFDLIPTNGRPKKVYKLSEDIIQRLVCSSRSSTTEKLMVIADEAGIEFNSVSQLTMNRVESDVFSAISVICDQYSDVELVSQYLVAGFNVDMAIVSDYAILLIECDEAYHHNSTTAKNDNERTRIIFDALGGEFQKVSLYRFSYDKALDAIANISRLISSDVAIVSPLLISNHHDFSPIGFRAKHH